MGYTPYKMKGHELPGPNQRTPAMLKSFNASDGAINENMVRKTSTKSGTLWAEGGVGSSPAKGWLSNIGKSLKKIGKKALDPLGLKDKAKKALGIDGDKGGGNNAELEARVTALEESSSGGGDAQAATAMGKVTRKKKLPWGLGGVGGGDGTGLGQDAVTLASNIVPLQGGMPYKKKK